MKLIALRAFPYGRLNLKAGQEFEASPRDSRMLIAVGRAVAASVDEPVAEPPRQKRKYTRRDMQAE